MLTRGTFMAALGLLIASMMLITSCKDNVGTTFEDSVAPYMELQAIAEASDMTVTLNKGTTKGLDSYFAFDMSNIQPNGLIRSGMAEGWCLEWDKPIAQNNDVHTGIEMYSTYGSDTWRPANYLMNIVDELRAEDPELTYREIQVALWSVIESPAFDMHKVLENGEMPERLMDNGMPNFSVSKVEDIVSRVRNEYQAFSYSGNKYLSYANTGPDKQNGGVMVGAETAWGVSLINGSFSDLALQFCGNSDIQGANWGWTNGPYEESEVTHSLALYAGAGQCDLNRGTFVGTFTFTYINGQLQYTIEMTETSPFTNELYNLIKYQIHVGSDILPSSPSPQATYTSAPGQFDTIVENLAEGTTVDQGTIPGLSGPIWVAVHADVSGFDPEN